MEILPSYVTETSFCILLFEVLPTTERYIFFLVCIESYMWHKHVKLSCCGTCKAYELISSENVFMIMDRCLLIIHCTSLFIVNLMG